MMQKYPVLFIPPPPLCVCFLGYQGFLRNLIHSFYCPLTKPAALSEKANHCPTLSCVFLMNKCSEENDVLARFSEGRCDIFLSPARPAASGSRLRTEKTVGDASHLWGLIYTKC